MKRLLSIVGLFALWTGLCMADGIVTITAPVQLTNISVLSTNQTSVTQTYSADGFIQAVFIGITNSMSTATNSVSVAVQVYDGMNIWRMVYTNSGLTASTVVYPSVNRQTVTGSSTNTAIAIPVYQAPVKVTAYNNGSTNTTVTVWMITSGNP